MGYQAENFPKGCKSCANKWAEVKGEEMMEDREDLLILEKKKMLIYAQVCLLSYFWFPAEMAFLAWKPLELAVAFPIAEHCFLIFLHGENYINYQW